ncbi:uncharacterized protein EI90DRAFT_3056929 [Cantharellus anzutake]|uniref:uncharacterized protein n=1 Tax=Cantharellus anzutake TaxID=1750568 RepID=UPI0019043D44|nr:uncharacterized protein EI90DRAFT_3056929 [Cantharellus anzutake]KAF8331678.1 hypothetical protein EI90DRAFT_3056929 [Cantharellus anzutake]
MFDLLKLPHGDFEALLIGEDGVVLFRIGSMFYSWDPNPSSTCWFPGNWTLSSFLSELRSEGLPPAIHLGDCDCDEDRFQQHFEWRYILGREVGAIDTIATALGGMHHCYHLPPNLSLILFSECIVTIVWLQDNCCYVALSGGYSSGERLPHNIITGRAAV